MKYLRRMEGVPKNDRIGNNQELTMKSVAEQRQLGTGQRSKRIGKYKRKR